MKKIYHLLLCLICTSSIFCSCSSDDSSYYDPYSHQEDAPFYPREVKTEKSSNKRNVSEVWTFEYDAFNKITAYTRETVTILQRESGEETTTEKENGQLSYNGDDVITNTITIEKEVEGFDYRKYQKENIIEIARYSAGHITKIERFISLFNEAGEKLRSTQTERKFEYSGDHCTWSQFTDKSNADNPITCTYTYDWDSDHKLTTIETDEKSSDSRIRKAYRYKYGKLSKDHGFQTNAFLYNQLPHIYAAMGYFGKDCPYTIYHEQQSFKLLNEGTWEADPTADSDKIYTPISNSANEFKYDISSSIYSTTYQVKFIK